MKSIYSSIMTTKNGSQIPVFHSGRTAESKYNPQLEAQRIVDGIEKKFDFFILIGVSSGILLKSLVQKFTQSVFFCIEISHVKRSKSGATFKHRTHIGYIFSIEVSNVKRS